MSATSDRYTLEAQADALDALASLLWYSSDRDRLAVRLQRAAELLREPLREEDDER